MRDTRAAWCGLAMAMLGGMRSIVRAIATFVDAAACDQHDAVDWVPVEDLDQTQMLQVAVEHRSRAPERLLDRVNCGTRGDTRCVRDALTRALGELDVKTVAGPDVRAAVGDPASRGPAGSDLLNWQVPRCGNARRAKPVKRDSICLSRPYAEAGLPCSTRARQADCLR